MTDAPEGMLVVDKPAGWTSHDVVARVRRLVGSRRVGHAGTLDPMATGVLVLGVGRATRLLTFLVGCDKAYTGTVRLGQATVTDDAQGEVTASTDVGTLDEAALAAAVVRLTGDIEQVPSAVSAVRVDGRRSYARVRGGEQVRLRPRPVTVRRFVHGRPRPASVLGADGHPHRVVDLDIEVEVSSGTYVRALARDLGDSLGVGGHLTALRRTRVAGFDLSVAHEIAELTRLAAEAADGGEGPGIPLVPLGEVARGQLRVHELTAEQAVAVGHGRRVESLRPHPEGPVAAFAPDGRLVAVLDESGRLARAHVVFAPTGS